MDRATVVDWLGQSAETMVKEDALPGLRARALRRLQSLMHHAFTADVDPDIRLLAFFLDAFVQALFTDLLGDIPDDSESVLFAIRNTFFRKAGEGLEALTIDLRKGLSPLSALEKLVAAYATAIQELDNHDFKLEGRRWQILRT